MVCWLWSIWCMLWPTYFPVTGFTLTGWKRKTNMCGFGTTSFIHLCQPTSDTRLFQRSKWSNLDISQSGCRAYEATVCSSLVSLFTQSLVFSPAIFSVIVFCLSLALKEKRPLTVSTCYCPMWYSAGLHFRPHFICIICASTGFFFFENTASLTVATLTTLGFTFSLF